MNSAHGMLPALNCHIRFPCCCVSPVSCRFVCKLSKRPVLNRVWRPHPRVPVTAGSAGVCASTTTLGLAAQPRPARRAVPSSVPTCQHTAWPLVFGQEPARYPVPDPQPSFDYACAQRSGEKLNARSSQRTLTSFHVRARRAS